MRNNHRHWKCAAQCKKEFEGVCQLLKYLRNYVFTNYMDFPGGSDGKESTCNVGDLGSIPGSRRFPGEGHGYLLQYFGLENSMDRGAWQATVHRFIQSMEGNTGKKELRGWVAAVKISEKLYIYILYSSVVKCGVLESDKCGFKLVLS